MYRLKITAVIVVFLCSTTISEGKFPKSPKPCLHGDVECIKRIINFLLSEKVDGYASLNLISLNPLKVAEISIKQGKESPVNIDLRFQKGEVSGIKDAKAIEVKGFGEKIDQIHEITLASDSVTLYSDYTIKGKVLILPISGTGKSNITMDNVLLKMEILGEPLIKGGETYMNIKNLKLNIETTRIRFDFKNLFNGDKILGDNMNLFLNENWKDIYGEVRGSITSAFASIFKSVISNVFAKYPYNKLFA